ncbi:MAG: hypothetical protein ACJAZP_000659 [Psychromonas sp.]|jgi:hypothetical protein
MLPSLHFNLEKYQKKKVRIQIANIHRYSFRASLAYSPARLSQYRLVLLLDRANLKSSQKKRVTEATLNLFLH